MKEPISALYKPLPPLSLSKTKLQILKPYKPTKP